MILIISVILDHLYDVSVRSRISPVAFQKGGSETLVRTGLGDRIIATLCTQFDLGEGEGGAAFARAPAAILPKADAFPRGAAAGGQGWGIKEFTAQLKRADYPAFLGLDARQQAHQRAEQQRAAEHERQLAGRPVRGHYLVAVSTDLSSTFLCPFHCR